MCWSVTLLVGNVPVRHTELNIFASTLQKVDGICRGLFSIFSLLAKQADDHD